MQKFIIQPNADGEYWFFRRKVEPLKLGEWNPGVDVMVIFKAVAELDGKDQVSVCKGGKVMHVLSDNGEEEFQICKKSLTIH